MCSCKSWRGCKSGLTASCRRPASAQSMQQQTPAAARSELQAGIFRVTPPTERTAHLHLTKPLRLFEEAPKPTHPGLPVSTPSRSAAELAIATSCSAANAISALGPARLACATPRTCFCGLEMCFQPVKQCLQLNCLCVCPLHCSQHCLCHPATCPTWAFAPASCAHDPLSRLPSVHACVCMCVCAFLPAF